MDKEKLKGWLTTEGKDREWLAGQLGCSKGTIDQWFSRGFPEWAHKSIARLMTPAGTNTSGLEVSFSAQEFERIETARKLLGMDTRKLYYETAISEFTDGILAREQTDPAIRESTITAAGTPLKLFSPAREHEHEQLRVAEPTAPTVADHLVKGAQMFDAAHPLSPPTEPAIARSVHAPPPASSPRPKP